MSDEVLLRLELRCNERAPRLVRNSLSCLDELGQATEEMVLISSELVSNAVLHSGCNSSDLLDVSLTRGERGYLLSVRDPGLSGTSAGPSPARPSGYGGLGMKIVESLSSRWGQSRGRGYQVWAEVAA